MIKESREDDYYKQFCSLTLSCSNVEFDFALHFFPYNLSFSSHTDSITLLQSVKTFLKGKFFQYCFNIYRLNFQQTSGHCGMLKMKILYLVTSQQASVIEM